METTEKKAFRKAFIGGFSKKDVNNYIADATLSYSKKIEELEKKILEQADEMGSLASRLADAEAVKEELEAKRSELTSANEKVVELEDEVSKLSAKLSEKEAECERSKRENEFLSKKVEVLAAAEAEYTAKKAELAEIEISARSRASALISETERELLEKKQSFESEIEMKRKSYEERREEALRETKDSLSAVQRLVGTLKGEVEGIDSRLLRITDSARNNVSMISNAVDSAEEKVSKIGEAIAKLEE